MTHVEFQRKLKKTGHDVENTLQHILPNPEEVSAKRLAQAMKYGSLGQGKRLRPFFVIESAALAKADYYGALRVAAAIEMVHCYSLIHDDLPAFDDDDLRRGKPTTHIVYDDATAILAGNSLLSLAFQTLVHEKTHINLEIRIALIELLAKASGVQGICGGQMLDMQAENGKCQTMGEITKLQSLKTGALFRAALLSGAILGNAKADLKNALEIYAENIGLAFQLADDLLDHEATTEQLGKRTGKDSSRGKATFIDIMGVEGARKYARNLIKNACEVLSPWDKEAQSLKEGALYIIERKH